MAVTTTTEAAELIEQRVSTIVTETLIQNAVSLGGVRDFSSMVSGGMNRLDIPLFNELAIQNVSESAEVTAQTIDPTESQLDLDQHKSVPWAISDKASLQSKLNMVAEAVKNGSRSLAAQIDDYIFGLINAGVSTAAPDHRIALTANPLEDLSNAKKLMDEQNIPRDGRFVFASPSFVKSLLDQNTIVNANQYGSAEARMAGFVDRIFGFTILESSSPSIVDGGFQATHMDAVAFARQMSVSLKSEYKVLAHRWEYSMSHLYGAVLVDGKRCIVYDSDGV
jgi:hypothetical protein